MKSTPSSCLLYTSDNWDAISPIFKFSTTVRTVIYTTNAIESLNYTYRKLNRQRSVFPSDTALLKDVYKRQLGINTEGKKEVLTISVGDNESAKYWLSVMNELKNRGVKDVLILSLIHISH